ncbi:MAG: PQQ-dependent sugar dehydrogenase [Deltaproteobacteria bacterium]|nr:PQQ-dependent sugar dehydrogenase [Deltaproteobacteria bacterium]MDQ3296763.1 PQQ-dependent sugar dehydrogenase [Myxococcota bacterium]
MAPGFALASLVLAVLAGGGCGGNKKTPDDAPQGLPRCASPVAGSTVTMRKIGTVVGGAMLATSLPDDPRLFVIEQRGAIRVFNAEQLLPDPFLDLSADNAGPVIAGGEQGLLGLAFHPRYVTTGLFFVFYTTRIGGLRDVVARCQVSAASPDRADPTCTEILSIDDFAGNHNGGMIEFGKDGHLYIATGDGGGAGDPGRTSQDPNSLLGKILRIDVDATSGGKQYGIPSDNPFAGGGGAPEVFILGLRNPWRWSFDRETGDMWIGDVGQGQIEELTVLRAGQQNGKNLGWSIYEGNGCCATQGDNCAQSGTQYPCEPANLVFPQDSRTHADGWISIIAGQTYRGTCYPDLVGWHFYTDYGKGGLVKARLKADNTLEIVDLPGSFPREPASLHEDARGELYMTTTSGDVYHLEASP